MKSRNNGSRIFLTELMFSILFFIVIVAVCVQCFASSVVMTREAKELSEATAIASNAAEVFLATDDDQEFTAYYDSEWNECDAEDATVTYRATGIISEENGIKTINITVSSLSDDDTIYRISVEKPAAKGAYYDER